MKEKIQGKLERLAQLKSVPFCYGCYKEAPKGKCQSCGSDDLMRLVRGSGCEYGYDWIIEKILKEFETVDVDEKFEEYVRECYSEVVKVGWIEVDASIIKHLDPVSWQLAKNEWLDYEVEDEMMVTFDGGETYFDLWGW